VTISVTPSLVLEQSNGEPTVAQTDQGVIPDMFSCHPRLIISGKEGT